MRRSGRVIAPTLPSGHGSATCIGFRHCGSGATLWVCGRSWKHGRLPQPSSAWRGGSGGSGIGAANLSGPRMLGRQASADTGNTQSFFGGSADLRGCQRVLGITTMPLGFTTIDVRYFQLGAATMQLQHPPYFVDLDGKGMKKSSSKQSGEFRFLSISNWIWLNVVGNINQFLT